MNKIRILVSGIVALLSLSSLAFIPNKNITPNDNNTDINYQQPVLSLVNIQQYGHSDGYFKKNNNRVFVGTNHYRAQLEVKYNGQIAFLNVRYSITDPNITGANESDSHPNSLAIGEEILSGSDVFEDRFVKNTSMKELKKLNDIGLSQIEFDKSLKRKFTKVYYI